jgi:hypothetical protein
MTPRERVLKILEGEKPDMVPWFGDLDYLATALIGRKNKPENFKGTDDYIKWHRELGVGFYLQGYSPFKTILEKCEERTWYESNKRYHEIITPKGKLRECWQWLPESFSEAPIEHLLKSINDLLIYRYILENARYESDYEYAKLRLQQVGEMGIVLCYLPRTPFMHLAVMDAGIELLTYLDFDSPDEFRETMDVMKISFDKAAKIAIDSPAEVLMIPENLSSEMVGKVYFEKYLKEYQTDWVNKISNSGKYSFIHIDGSLRGLLNEEARIGFNVLEALTPAPVGDVSIEEWEKIVGNSKSILWGGIPGVYFTPNISDEEFEKHVKRVLETMSKAPRFVLGVADQVPPDGLEERVKRVGELVEDCGKYQS